MKKINASNAPYYAAIAQTLQYGHVGFIYLGAAGLITAGALGALMSFAVALASSKINDIAKVRKLSAWILFVVLLIISPAFVGVGMYVALDVIPSLFWRFVVSALWGLIPDGSIALVGFITGKGLVADAERIESKLQAKESGRKRTAKKSLKVPCEWCGKAISDSQNARNAHAQYCKVLQEASKQ